MYSTYIFKSNRWNLNQLLNRTIQFRFDILVTRNQNNTFMTSIYRKKTFTGLYTKWDSFTPRKCKINLIRSLTYRYYRVCSSGSLLQSSLNDLRKLLLQNGYPQGIINYHINDVLNKNRNQHSNPVSTVPKKDIIILLPYLGLQSNQVAKRLKSCVYIFYSCAKVARLDFLGLILLKFENHLRRQ